MRPGGPASGRVDRLDTNDLVGLAAPVLIHHYQNAVNLVTVACIEDQIAACSIGASIIKISDRVRCIGNDIGTIGISKIKVLDAIPNPLIHRPIFRRIMNDASRVNRASIPPGIE